MAVLSPSPISLLEQAGIELADELEGALPLDALLPAVFPEGLPTSWQFDGSPRVARAGGARWSLLAGAEPAAPGAREFDTATAEGRADALAWMRRDAVFAGLTRWTIAGDDPFSVQLMAAAGDPAHALAPLLDSLRRRARHYLLEACGRSTIELHRGSAITDEGLPPLPPLTSWSEMRHVAQAHADYAEEITGGDPVVFSATFDVEQIAGCWAVGLGSESEREWVIETAAMDLDS